jgi:translation initiation factor eIF-2B subunit gamma
VKLPTPTRTWRRCFREKIKITNYVKKAQFFCTICGGFLACSVCVFFIQDSIEQFGKKMLENDSSSASLSSVGAVEFQVVLLAGGPGSRMSPLSTEIPKPLLPIANRPMISYQLEFLERAGFSGACTCLQRGGINRSAALLPFARVLIDLNLFSDVIIIAQDEASSELRSYVHEIYKGKLRVDWHFLADTMGTAEALLQIKDKIKVRLSALTSPACTCRSPLMCARTQTNFIVMSSDLVVDEKFLHGMADLHRLQDAMVTVLISRPKPAEGAAAPVVDTKNEYGLMDYVGLKEDGERLLYFKAAADIENKMRISKKLLRKYVHA